MVFILALNFQEAIKKCKRSPIDRFYEINCTKSFQYK